MIVAGKKRRQTSRHQLEQIAARLNGSPGKRLLHATGHIRAAMRGLDDVVEPPSDGMGSGPTGQVALAVRRAIADSLAGQVEYALMLIERIAQELGVEDEP